MSQEFLMNPDDPVCLCFHVTRRKVISFIRVEKPKRPSQLSNCYGAGTGCGWCRTYLERMLKNELAKSKPSSASETNLSSELSSENSLADMSLIQYKKARSQYVKEGGGSPPPGATPVDE